MSLARVPPSLRTARKIAPRSLAYGALLIAPLFASCRSGVSGEAHAAPPKAAAPAPDVSPVAAAAANSQQFAVLEPVGAEPVRVRIEVAQSAAERQRGLMYRKQLDPDAGMLFVFDKPQHNVFWMHNTFLPLDMLFITRDWTVLGIVENATPQTDSPREVPGDSLYVLEVNAGFSRQHGITQGTKVQWIKSGPAK